MAQLDAFSNWCSGGRGFDPRWVQQHSVVETRHEIFSGHSVPSTNSRRAVNSF